MPHPRSPYIVQHPEAGSLVVLDPAVNYDPDDILVKAYAWAFAPVDTSPGIVESVRVEQATAAPGEKRSLTGRPPRR
jgi:hypothetical protein